MTSREREDSFRYAANLLNSPDALESDPTPKDPRALPLAAKKLLYGNVPTTVVDQLNRWIGMQKPSPDWRPDPLLESLPKSLRESNTVKQLGELRFSPADAVALREVVWLRELSDWICGDSADSLDRAQKLFDWTVRNIQLEAADEAGEAPPKPSLAWHLLVLGRGQAEDRAWLFMLLARQQGLDVVLLKPAKSKQTVLLGLALGGRAYVFDALLGLPIPGLEGRDVATLAQLAENDELLRRLDLGADNAYPLASADLADLTAQLEGSPLYLEHRTALVEAKLTGEQKLVLSTDPSALAKRLKAIPQIKRAELWPLPYERLRGLSDRKSAGVSRLAKEFEPLLFPITYQKQKRQEFVAVLWQGRVQHLLGNFTGAQGANHYYQAARLPDAQIEAEFAAFRATLEKIQDPQVKEEETRRMEAIVALARTVKQDASYWLGLAAFERGNFKTAADYFEKRTLEASPDGPWTPGARYNLGRAWEALNDGGKAIKAYRSDESAQRRGALLRARRLESEADVADKPPAEPSDAARE